MSDAEHLIENVIFAYKYNKDVDEVLDYPYNRMMLEETGINKDDLKAMAIHVVYSLYDGEFPKM